jgi:hypothetical protein
MQPRLSAILACLAMFLTAAAASPVGAPAPAKSSYRVRVEVLPGERTDSPGAKSVVLAWSGHAPVTTPLTQTGWSQWIEVPAIEDQAAVLKPGGPPARGGVSFLGFFRASWKTDADTEPMRVRAEIADPHGHVWPVEGQLFGPDLGLALWKDAQGALQAGSMAQYNRRYWQDIPTGRGPTPRNFIIADRFIGGDDDAINWRDGFAGLRRSGVNTILVPPERALRPLLAEQGVSRIGWAVYAPEDKQRYVQAGDPSVIDTWADAHAAEFLRAGYSRTDMAVFALSDEPGWYYPAMLRLVMANPDILARFRAYLQAQALTPADVGASGWSSVIPIGRAQVKDLASRRLFYWSMRFAPADSARYFARVTQAMERAFYPGMPIFTNWDNNNGRLYTPGPVGHNRDTADPNAAMGMHDWFEFGRARGSTMLWTEDWFNDQAARQWSLYATRLESAVRAQTAPGVSEQFGGYIIPRMEGDHATPDGLVQKVMALVGHGGKAVQYFWFGPEYNFPGNCYSEVPGVSPQIRRASEMISAAEDLLWPGQPIRSPVAILMPRSAELWDAQAQPHPTDLSPVSPNFNSRTTDYMAEVADLYAALQDADIPVEFVDEDELTAKGLKPYSVLYVTEPDVPAEGQAAIAAWTRAGGTLASVANAATHDRYDQPFTALGPLTSPPRESALLGAIDGVRFTAASGPSGDFQAGFPDLGGRPAAGATVLARFGDGSPAIEAAPMGRGEHIHFAFMPGLSYARLGAGAASDGAGRAARLRNWVAYPVARAHVTPPVTASDSGVETPVLVSDKGAAVTVLNWRGAPLANLGLILRLPFQVGSIESVTHGRLAFTQTPGGVAIHLPLQAVDVLMVRPVGAKLPH